VPGGLCTVAPGLDGRHGGVDLLALEQDARGTLCGRRLHFRDGITFPTEARLVNTVDLAPFESGHVVPVHPFHRELAFDLAAPGVPYVCFFNFGPDANRRGSVAYLFPELRELAALAPFTLPAGDVITIAAVGGNPLRTPVGQLFAAVPLGAIRAQALYLEPRIAGGLPLMATGEIRWQLEPGSPRGIVVAAEGASSYDPDPLRGFFRITNAALTPTRAVRRLTLDWRESHNPAQASGMVFDTDQQGMGDLPSGGDSARAGCRGTYRNGSAQRVGLRFAPGQVAPPCDASAHAGFVGRNRIGAGGKYQTLEFAFDGDRFYGYHGGADGVFELDCDTDGGTGVDGAAMAGLVVTVELADGSVLRGELPVDPLVPHRSVLRF
jgi:hypothetical protein